MSEILREFLLSATTQTFGLGFLLGMLVMWLPRFVLRTMLRKKVEAAYMMLRMVCEPEILNPEYPGNKDYMKSQSRDMVNEMINHLEKAGFRSPPKCEINEKSLKEWFKFLEDVRIKLGSWL